MGRIGLDHHATKQTLLGFEDGLARPTSKCKVHDHRDTPTRCPHEIIKISREFTEITALSYGARAPLELVPRPGWLKCMKSNPTKPFLVPTVKTKR